MRESGGDAGAGMAGPRKQVPRWPSSMSVLWIRNTKPREVKSPVPYERDFGFIPYLLFTLACLLPLYQTSPWTLGKKSCQDQSHAYTTGPVFLLTFKDSCSCIHSTNLL